MSSTAASAAHPPAAHAPRPGVARATDGEPLDFVVRGEGTPLLILNGLVSTHHHWPFFIEHYQERAQVIFWDYRGHGGSPAPRDPASATIEQFADDAHAVLAAAGAAPAVVCGLSFGVQVALEHYRRHPGEVRALILICGTYGHPFDRVTTSPAVRRALAGFLRGFGRLGPLSRAALGIAKSGLPREIAYLTGGAHRTLCPRAALDGLFAHVAGLDPAVFGEICASYFVHTAADVLPTIAVPTLILAGEKDELTPPSLAAAMQRAIPDAELRVFDGHSHLVQLERPAAVHAAIDAFLAARGLLVP
jgi:pimeloyl-ACP methyl ester carboxylesterase